ncbi:hypothetical protein A2U01_0037372, partial [Trifolium medium]|nr:hypothetical protein [Trifolium medium]
MSSPQRESEHEIHSTAIEDDDNPLKKQKQPKPSSKGWSKKTSLEKYITRNGRPTWFWSKRLVENGYILLSFMDAYSGYNQIPMHEDDRDKTTSMTDEANF